MTAWRVEGYDREDVVLAASESEARAAFDGDDDSHDLIVTRSPEYDHCKTQQELVSAMLGSRWSLGCYQCEHTVDGHGCDDCEEGGREHDAPIVDSRGRVFCGPDCERAQWARWGTTLGIKHAACHEAVDRWPGITIVDANGTQYASDEARSPMGGVRFRFPGCEHIVSWARGGNNVWVAGCAADQWRAFDARCKGARVL